MRNRLLFNHVKSFRLRILIISSCLTFIGNNLSAQAVGDYRSNSIVPANWNVAATWQRWDGSAWVVADYPGQSTPAGAVTIQNGQLITLNVSPTNAIGSLVVQGGAANTALIISDGFTLNVTGLLLVNPPTAGAIVANAILINGAAAQLNCGSLTLVESGSDTWGTGLGFNGGIVNVTGNVTMGATQPQRTGVGFNTTGTLSVGGNLSGGTIATATGTGSLNVVGNLTDVTIVPGTTGNMNISGNLINPIISAGSGTINLAGGIDNPTVSPTYTGTVNFNGVGVQSLIGDAIFPNIGMTNALSILTLNGNLEVTGTLTLTAGKIELGPNLLGLTNAIPANQLVGGSSSSYVFGTSPFGRFVRQNLAAATAYNFPLGTLTNYMPVIITPTDVSNFAVNAFSPASTDGTVGGPPFINNSRIVDAMWLIERPAGTGNSTITIQWADALEGTIFTAFGDGQIGISRNASGTWLPAIANSANAAANTVTATFNAFTMFGVGEIDVVLPVKFGSIKAYEKQTGIQLDWKVYSENKVKNYEIERSSDARSFTTVGSLPALYNNTADGDYGFFDVNPLQGTSYYRIKNNDLDGKSAYSIIVRVNRNKTIKGLSLYPNPVVNGTVLLQGSDLGRGNYKINIFGANGQEIYKQQIIHNGGTISHTIELPPTISKGVYIFSVKDENGNIIFEDKLVNQ